MQGDSRSEVIKSIFKDITNLQEVIDETKTVQNKYEKEEDINQKALDGYITSTKKIVTSLKDSVDKIHNYFDENFKDWTAQEEADVKVDFSSSVGKIKLVDLSKLIDPSRARNLESPPAENDAIVILSDSGSEEPVVPAKKKSRRNSENNNLYEPENKEGKRNSRSILKSRLNGLDSSLDNSVGNKESTPDRVTKKVQFANKDTVILSRLTSKSSSSSSESEEEVIRAPVKRSSREKSKKTVISSESSEEDDEYELPDDTELQLDKKFSWKCTVNLTRISAEKLKSKYNEKFEDRELKRLTSWKSLKRSHSKKSDSSSDSSDSTKTPKKKRHTKGSKKSRRKSITSSSDSDSSKSSSSVKLDATVADSSSLPNEDVEPSMNEVILNTIEAPEENNAAVKDPSHEKSDKIDKARDSDNNTKTTEPADKNSDVNGKEKNQESDEIKKPEANTVESCENEDKENEGNSSESNSEEKTNNNVDETPKSNESTATTEDNTADNSKKSSKGNKSDKSSGDDTDDDDDNKRIDNSKDKRKKTDATDSDNTSDSGKERKKKSKRVTSDDDDKNASSDSNDDKNEKEPKDISDREDNNEAENNSAKENSTDADKSPMDEASDKVEDKISDDKESSELNDSTTKEDESNMDNKVNKSDDSSDEKKTSDNKSDKSSGDESDNKKKKKKRVGNSRGDRSRKKYVSNSDSSDSDASKKEKRKKSSKKKSSDDENKGKNGKPNEEKKNSSNSDESDDEKKKEKSKWKKDKLLTSKLLDSDEEYDAFKKKKEQLKTKKDESDSDCSPKPKSKKKKVFKKRTKNVISDSDSDNNKKASSSSSSESSEPNEKNSSSDSEAEKKKEEEKKKKSRKRIKRVNSSSDEEGDKSTRKQIRKVLTKDSLAETTIQAEKDEAERKARILEKQKKYNNIFEEEKLEKATLDKVVLDFNEETREELLVVEKSIVKKLKPHQGKGVQFMWDACFESIDRAKNTAGSGCILAHCMGLGKTLQIITLVHTLIKNQEKTGVEKVLVVCPLSTVLNWVSEFKKWLPNDEIVEVFDLVAYKQNRERIYQTMEWHKNGGVLVLGYDMFRNLTNENNKRLSKKLRSDFKTALVDPGPDLVVCDEGHLLKNEKTSLSISMNKLKTARRIVLTGTPLQNNLKEYWCMVQFVKPNLLGTYKEYLNRFVNPIVNGQYTDSTPHDIQIMRKRSHVLHKMLDGVVQRRDYSVLAPFLPPKHEYVVFIKLTETQVKLYTHYMKEFARKQSHGGGKSYIFVDFQELQRICTHPRVLLDKSIQNRIAKEKKDWENDDESEGSLKDFIDDGSDAESSTNESSSGSSSNESDDKKKSKSNNKFTRRTRAMADQQPESEEEEVVPTDPSEWWRQYTTGDELDNIIHSGKLHLLFEILQQCEVIGDKVLVFSQSLYSLNVIEYFLSKIDEATQNKDSSLVGGYTGSWSLGLDYFRLDGSSSCDNRAAWCKTFNDPKNTRARLFLISTRAGGLGINLVAANRVIIFDVSWNPSHDIQSIYRVYRFGQTKPSYIYRFVTLGTMEMKIYERQVIKQAISKRVIDEQQIDRHYNQNDLAELYKFEPVPEEDRPIPLVPKDILLGELLQNYEHLIYKYHEHQSLLENKEDEVLDEAERKAAWEEFENEKKNRQFTANFRGMLGNSLQLPVTTIVAALTNIIRREHPTFTMLEIQGVIPQLIQEFNGQMAAGESTMYMKVITEIERMQLEQQQAKLAEYYKMQQQQQALRLFQKFPGGTSNLPQAQPEFLRYMQQMNQRQPPQNFNQPSNSRRQANPNMDPNEVVSLDD